MCKKNQKICLPHQKCCQNHQNVVNKYIVFPSNKWKVQKSTCTKKKYLLLLNNPPSFNNPPFLKENFQILKTCLIPTPLRTKNIVLISTFFQASLVDRTLWNVFLPMHWSQILPPMNFFMEFESHGVNKGQQNLIVA